MSVRIGHHLCLGMLAGLCMANVWASAERPTLVLGYPEREKKPFMAEAPNNGGIYQAILKRAAERVGAGLKIERLPKKRIFHPRKRSFLGPLLTVAAAVLVVFEAVSRF